MVDNLSPIGGGVADIVFGVVSDFLKILAGWRAGVEIANPLMVRDEIDAIANPHGGGQIPPDIQ